MFKTLAVLIVSLLTPHTQVLRVDYIHKILDSSVVIHAKVEHQTENGPKLGMIGCSGTFINGAQVLTAAHCFESPVVSIWVRGPLGGSHRAYIEKLDFFHDLALLNVVGPKHVAAKLATTVRIGEPVVNVGSPYFFEFLVSEGVVAQVFVAMKGFKSHYLISTAMINPGSSGGGAFNEQGELIGVNTMSIGMFGWTGISMAVSIEDIRRFLK